MEQTRSTRLTAAGVGLVLGMLLLALGLALWRGVGQAEQGRSDVGGSRAPSFTAPLFEAAPGTAPGTAAADAGTAFVLDEHADQPIFIYFWASWCLPCREEAQTIQEIWPEYRDRGYMFVGLNIWDLQRDAEAFIDEFGLAFPLARDAERSVYVEYGVQGLPAAFFLEPGLSIRSRYDGALDEATLRGLLDEIGGTTS
ncbi:MAG: TlpA family protein disulfide reductase [Dehalococcoidia bacterium]|nr:TlpA family protein disulfide reductase [Dehalococcoidia bacterium]